MSPFLKVPGEGVVAVFVVAVFAAAVFLWALTPRSAEAHAHRDIANGGDSIAHAGPNDLSAPVGEAQQPP